MTERLIIEAREGVTMLEALRNAYAVVCMGRVSEQESYCAVTTFVSGDRAFSFKNKASDRIVVMKEAA